ncbi:MAG: hypothetical protein ABIZ04_15780 [Opitutus sp.]
MNELRITDTNSVNDSKGRALGLEGNDFLFVVGGLVGAIAVFLLAYAMFGTSCLAASVLAAPVFVLPTGWVFLLRRNRPDGYAEDLFDQIVNREGWSFATSAQPKPIVRPPHA